MKKAPDASWPLRLFERSPLKQEKYAEIVDLLGDIDGLACLDIGSESGAISHLLRERGGSWKSADHDPEVVEAIRALVESDVYLIEGFRTPFADGEFDRIVVVDMLEHVKEDHLFAAELARILAPGGEVIVNSPHLKSSLLDRLRRALGLNEDLLGTVRLGYTLDALTGVLDEHFSVLSHRTYRRFFSQLFDTGVVRLLASLKRGERPEKHAPMVDAEDLTRHRKLYRAYTLLYPLARVLCGMDRWIPFDGYMVIVRARLEP